MTNDTTNSTKGTGGNEVTRAVEVLRYMRDRKEHGPGEGPALDLAIAALQAQPVGGEAVAWCSRQKNGLAYGSLSWSKQDVLDSPIFDPELDEAIPLYAHPIEASAQPEEPGSGFVRVPVEPTEEIINAMCAEKLKRLNRFAAGKDNGGGIVQGCRDDYAVIVTAARQKEKGK